MRKNTSLKLSSASRSSIEFRHSVNTLIMLISHLVHAYPRVKRFSVYIQCIYLKLTL